MKMMGPEFEATERMQHLGHKMSHWDKDRRGGMTAHCHNCGMTVTTTGDGMLASVGKGLQECPGKRHREDAEPQVPAFSEDR